MKELVLLSIATIFEGEKEVEAKREFSTHSKRVTGLFKSHMHKAIKSHLEEAYNIKVDTDSVKKAIAESEVSSEVEFFFEDGDKEAVITIRAISGYRVDFK